MATHWQEISLVTTLPTPNNCVGANSDVILSKRAPDPICSTFTMENHSRKYCSGINIGKFPIFSWKWPDLQATLQGNTKSI